jgi:hypothetical protein
VLQTGVDARTAGKIPWIQEQSAAPFLFLAAAPTTSPSSQEASADEYGL